MQVALTSGSDVDQFESIRNVSHSIYRSVNQLRVRQTKFGILSSLNLDLSGITRQLVGKTEQLRFRA